MKKYTSPASGRIVVREHPENYYTTAGFFHLDDVFVSELAGYECLIGQERIHLYTEAVKPKPVVDGLEGGTIDDHLRSNIWATTSNGGVLMRFFSAREDANEWLGVAVMKGRPAFVKEGQIKNGHAWFDIEAGRIKPIQAPINAQGMAVAEIFTGNPVWPSRDGTLYRLPANESSWRPVYLRHAHVLADIGDGLLNAGDYEKKLGQDLEMWKIRTYSIDPQYCRYLAAMRKEDGLKVDRPMTFDEYQDHKKIVQAAFLASADTDTDDVPSIASKARMK